MLPVFSTKNSYALLDGYSLTHIFWPLLITKIAMSIYPSNFVLLLIFLLSVVFEVVENLPSSIKKYRQAEIDSAKKSDYHGDTLLNAVGDILVNALGIYLATILDWPSTIIVLSILAAIITWFDPNYWRNFFKFLN
jgi:uncharacterized protein YybS (DUF2232 family)